MKLAQYECIQHGYTTFDDADSWIEEHEGYVRITEPVEVEFTPCDRVTVTEQQVAALDSMIEAIRAAAGVKVNEIKDRKAKLLALTHEPQ